MSLASFEFEFTTLSEGEPLFAPALRRLQILYSRAYARGSTSMLGPLGHEYELERQPEAGTHIYLFPFGGNPSPIWVHEHRETNIGSEAGDHSYLSLIIDNPYPGEALLRLTRGGIIYDEGYI